MTPEEIRNDLIKRDQQWWKDSLWASFFGIITGVIFGLIIINQ